MGLLNVGTLLVTRKVWQYLIEMFVSFLGNFGWAIILFTIALKVILFPLDVMQRRTTKKNSQMQALVQPEIAALQKKYPGDKDKINQGTMAIYKKYNYNVVGSCVVLFLNIVITLVVFFTLFQSLNYISQTKLINQYTELKTVYEQAITNGEDENVAVLDKYEEIKDENGWLWITNVWKSDTYTKAMLSFDEYYKKANLQLTDEEKATAKVEYETIEAIIYSDETNAGWNGYFILVVLAGVVSFLAQYITTKSMKPKNGQNANDPSGASNKVMMLLMPVIMVVFAWTSTSIFSLYLITNSVMTIFTGLICNAILKDKDYTTPTKSQPRKTKVKVMEYSRNYFKGDEK